MPPQEEEQNKNKEKNDLGSENLLHNTQQQGKTPDDSTNNSNENKNKFLNWWRGLKFTKKIQIFGLLLNFFTLIAFLWISLVQISKTDETLKLTKDSFIASDTSTNKYLRMVDSSLDIYDKNMLASNSCKIVVRADSLKKRNNNAFIYDTKFVNDGHSVASEVNYNIIFEYINQRTKDTNIVSTASDSIITIISNSFEPIIYEVPISKMPKTNVIFRTRG